MWARRGSPRPAAFGQVTGDINFNHNCVGGVLWMTSEGFHRTRATVQRRGQEEGHSGRRHLGKCPGCPPSKLPSSSRSRWYSVGPPDGLGRTTTGHQEEGTLAGGTRASVRSARRPPSCATVAAVFKIHRRNPEEEEEPGRLKTRRRTEEGDSPALDKCPGHCPHCVRVCVCVCIH